MKLWVELDKKYLREEYNNDEQKMIDAENFYVWWYPKKIQKAFNFGNGTMKDLKRYINDNKCFCKFKEIEIPDDYYIKIMREHGKM